MVKESFHLMIQAISSLIHYLKCISDWMSWNLRFEILFFTSNIFKPNTIYFFLPPLPHPRSIVPSFYRSIVPSFYSSIVPSLFTSPPFPFFSFSPLLLFTSSPFHLFSSSYRPIVPSFYRSIVLFLLPIYYLLHTSYFLNSSHSPTQLLSIRIPGFYFLFLWIGKLNNIMYIWVGKLNTLLYIWVGKLNLTWKDMFLQT